MLALLSLSQVPFFFQCLVGSFLGICVSAVGIDYVFSFIFLLLSPKLEREWETVIFHPITMCASMLNARPLFTRRGKFKSVQKYILMLKIYFIILLYVVTWCMCVQVYVYIIRSVDIVQCALCAIPLKWK